ncbi:hypothetical protein CWATWH0402_5349 [Crocosphaera watsonii WH 0402]|uniref:Uncharacterized protein n=1 Tax=Crocosphaera watsonii WH 0402 TaxID=1284629 RepID=T2JPQ5_CROWT|nr:hypothetical protein CWATWH0402_5349 [Crocosphaera watsonii WH 0402]
MNQLEKELLETFKNFAIQYEKDKQQQNEQMTNLTKQINSLNNTINNLSNRITELENAYQDIMNVLEK